MQQRLLAEWLTKYLEWERVIFPNQVT